MIPSSFSWLPLLFVSFAKNSLTVGTNSCKIQLVMFLCPAVWVLYFSHCLLFSLNGKGVGLNMPHHPVASQLLRNNFWYSLMHWVVSYVSSWVTGSCILGSTFQWFLFFPPCASKLIPGKELRICILLFFSFKDQVVSLLSGQQRFSPKAPKEPCSLANTEKLKAQLLQVQTELNNSKQEYEEFKELTR